MIEHPHPTDATVKFLYAHAFRCAYPDCQESLYREDRLSGKWVLNSRICHICARSEGGPRWNAEQSPEENRSEANLLLMCTAHASAIDDPKTLDHYPAELLGKWKASQLKDHRERMMGWPLTEAMAAEALTFSFSNVGVAITNSTVSLGGEPGSAPGAGGGGGGAIGRDARGGRGGKGGPIVQIGGESPSMEDLTRLLQALPARPTPGAGGAGAGAVGPGAVAGDGGDGGELQLGTIHVEAGDRFKVTVGAGGKPGRLPGQHGTPGGDTVLIHESSDGAVKQVYRARGGAAPQSGAFPDDWIPVSEADLIDGFQISTLLIANSVELRERLLYVLGGGWSTFTVTSLPLDATWPVICRATWTRLTPGHTRGLHLCLSAPDRQEVSRLALELPESAGAEDSWTWIRVLAAPLNREGMWRVSVQSAEFLLSAVTISVALREP